MSPCDHGCCALDGDCDLLSLLLDNDLPQPAPDPPCDSVSTGSQGTKRKSNDNKQLGESSMHEAVISRKKPRVDGNFSCPYRRRNPQRFNVRDFPTCAHKSFSNITLVKRHVKSAHTAQDFALQCRTCSGWFRTQRALDRHSGHQTCSSLQPLIIDEYDKGITEEMANRLRDRRDKTKVLEWEGLWRTIFPTSQAILAPDFVPVREYGEGRE